MYNYLSGQLISKAPTSVVLDVNGIGYEIMVSLATSQKLPEPGSRVTLKTYFIVREDAQILFGFATEEERALFKLLISVSGVGPKTALTALSGIELAELKRAIVEGSVATLTSVPGIGRKTAERLIVELREKIIIGKGEEISSVGKSAKDETLLQDSLQALVSLGYSKQAAKTAIQKVYQERRNEGWNAEKLIRESLKYI